MSGITAMSDDSSDVDFFGMIYSEFGMGKTVTTMGLAQALRGDGDILFCDSSDGWVSLQEFPTLMEHTDHFRVTDPADLVVVANGIASGKLKSRRKKRISVVVIDESSSIFDTMLEQYVREKYGLSPDEPFPEIEGREYGPATMAFESLLRKFHNASGVHVILTAHAREVGEGGTRELRPSFPPKAYAVVMRKLHVCAALSARRKKDMQTKETYYERSVQLLPSAVVSAKSRIPGSPLKCDPLEFIELVTNWVDSDSFVSDVNGKAPKQVVADAEEETETLEGDDEEIDTEETEVVKKAAPRKRKKA